MTKAMASRLLLQRRLFRFLQLSAPSSSAHTDPFFSVKPSEIKGLERENALLPPLSTFSRCFCSHSSNLVDESQGPAAIDYRYDTSHVFHSSVIL